MFTTVPPGPPVIYNERGIIVETSLGPYNEGVELILTCSVSGGKSLAKKRLSTLKVYFLLHKDDGARWAIVFQMQ